MNVQIPDHISAIKSYVPGKTIAQLRETYGWERTAILWNNENTLGFSPKSREAVLTAYEGINYYPDPVALDLRKKLADKHGLDVNRLVLGNGSESVLMMAIRALCVREDEFLTSEGSFVIVHNWARINNVRFVSMPMTEDYSFDLEAMKRRINRDTKIIYLANVNNPTGLAIYDQELKTFIESVPDHILVIVDEAYFEFSQSLDPDFPDSISYPYPNVLTLRTFSKAYGIAGVRLGYGIGHPKIIEALFKVKLTFEPTALAQAAGLGALEDEAFLQKTIDNNKKELPRLSAALSAHHIHFLPSLGNFLMTVWESEAQMRQVFDALMKKGVLIRPLSGPLSHCARISVGRPDENDWLIEQLQELDAVVNR